MLSLGRVVQALTQCCPDCVGGMDRGATPVRAVWALRAGSLAGPSPAHGLSRCGNRETRPCSARSGQVSGARRNCSSFTSDRTTNIGAPTSSMRCAAVLPRRVPAGPVRPWLASTISSALQSP